MPPTLARGLPLVPNPVSVKFMPAMAWRAFLGASALAYLLMLPGPFMQMNGDMAAIVTLELMHVVLVAAVLGGISKLGRG